MSTAQICIMATIIVYLCLVIFTGVMIGRRSKKSAEGFYLGGRGIGPLVTAMSAEASDMSSYLLMGIPGLAYLSGVADASWTAIGLAVGTYLNFLLVAKRLRRYSVKLDAITIPSFISKRYGEKKPVIMCISALIILIFFVPYVASGLAAIGKLFNSLFGWDYMTAVVIGAVVIISYTSVGGFSAVATMDLIQSIIMTIALAVIVVFGIVQAGGLDAVLDHARTLPGFLSFGETYNAATHSAEPYGLIRIVSMMAWGLGYFGMPHILVRFMAIRDENELTLSRRIAAVWVVISMFIAILIGIIGYSVSIAGKVPLLGSSAESETIVIQLSNLLSQYGPISDTPMDRYSDGRLDDLLPETLYQDRVLYLSFPVTVPAGGSAEVSCAFWQAPSYSHPCSGAENADLQGFDLMTRLGSSLEFTRQSAALVNMENAELTEENFGFLWEEGRAFAELDLEQEHYYLIIRPKES